MLLAVPRVMMVRSTFSVGKSTTVDRALILDLMMIILGSSVSLSMVDHTLIDVSLANVYLHSPYDKGLCKVMCVSSPCISCDNNGNVRGACQMLPGPDQRLMTRAEELEF